MEYQVMGYFECKMGEVPVTQLAQVWTLPAASKFILR